MPRPSSRLLEWFGVDDVWERPRPAIGRQDVMLAASVGAVSLLGLELVRSAGGFEHTDVPVWAQWLAVSTGAALLARGLSNGEIARDLVLGETTVKTHVSHVLAEPDRGDHRRGHPAAAPAGGQGAGQHRPRRDPVLIYLAVGLIGLSFTHYKSYVPALSGPTAWFVGFFLAGFIALPCLWAVAGSLASRTEDLQATSTPLTMLMLAMFFGGVSLDGRGQVIASFVPPVSAVVMPKRILAGGVEWWEPLVALGLLAVFAAVTVWVGERLYRRALLQTGGRVSLRQAWSAAE